MKILLVVEAGFEEDDHVGFDGAGTWFDDTGRTLPFNADNENALELALRLKEQVGKGCHLTVLCVGGKRAREAVRRCLSFGCDRGIQIVDYLARRRREPHLASIIARFCARTSFEVIITGAGFGNVGAHLAQALGRRSVRDVAVLRYQHASQLLGCELEDGSPAPLLERPTLLISRSGDITPRIPSLATQFNARQKQIVSYQVTDFLEGTGRPVSVAGKPYAATRPFPLASE